jgi:glycerol-3-phosphate acyltransferase PlsY
MTDNKATIETAYADALKGLYAVMLSSYSFAGGDKATEKKADDSFRAGLALAIKVRDRALALL